MTADRREADFSRGADGDLNGGPLPKVSFYILPPPHFLRVCDLLFGLSFHWGEWF